MIAKRTKLVQLTFIRDELLYDCKNIAYVAGDVMGEDMQHAKHQVQDIGEDGNVDRVNRVLDLAFARCVEMCYPYSKREVEGGESVDDHHLRGCQYGYRMELLVPDDFSQTTVIWLKELIHEYLVCRVLGDWFGITNRQLSAYWESKAEDAAETLRNGLNSRVGRVRKTQTPF